VEIQESGRLLAAGEGRLEGMVLALVLGLLEIMEVQK
jgi:hypothetical protein